MKIKEITKAEIHIVTTDEEDCYEYTRYSATNWTMRIVESDEPVYDCKELEDMFQSALAKALNKTDVSSGTLEPQLCKDCNNHKEPYWTSKICGECFFYDNNQQSNFIHKFK